MFPSSHCNPKRAFEKRERTEPIGSPDRHEKLEQSETAVAAAGKHADNGCTTFCQPHEILVARSKNFASLNGL